MTNLEQNLKDIRGEAGVMLENLKAVRGKQYADAVQLLLNVRQTSTLFQLVMRELEQSTEMHPRGREYLGDMMATLLTSVSLGAFEVAGIPNEMWKEALKDAEALHKTVNNLMDTAWHAHLDGKEFGGRDAG